MSIGIIPPSTDPQIKISVLDKVKSAVSGLPGKLRDIFNTMIPGRTGSFILPKSWSPQPSFASSMAGVYSTRSSNVGTESGKHARQASSSRSSERDSRALSMSSSSSARRSIVSIESEASARQDSDSSSCSSGGSSPYLSAPEGSSWLYSEGLRHIEETMQSEALHISRAPSDYGMHEGWRLPRISKDSQSRSSMGSSAVSIKDLPNPWEMSKEEIAEDVPRRLVPRISQDSQSRSSISSDASGLANFDFLDSMSDSSKA